MRAPHEPRNRAGEAGAVTLLVSLMLLVFITLTAVGMSRNAFREVVTSGMARQGALARNVADSGVEWSIFWMDYSNSSYATGSAANLNNLKLALLNGAIAPGRAWDVMSSSLTSPTRYTPASAENAVTLSPITTAAGTTLTQNITVGLTNMGKMPITDMNQGVGTGSFTPAAGTASKLPPDLWAVRTDAKVGVGALTFVHAKELWVSTPVQ